MKRYLTVLLFLLLPVQAFAQGSCGMTSCEKVTIQGNTGVDISNKGAGAVCMTTAVNTTKKGFCVAATTGELTPVGGAGITGDTVVTGAISATTTVTAGTGLTVTTGNATLTNGNVVFTAAQSGVKDNIATLAALGTNQASCAPVISTIARVTGADATVGVCLPAGAAGLIGRKITIINSDVTNALKVYSTGSDTITGQAGSTAISVAAKLILECTLFDATNWYCAKTVTPY